MKKKTTHFRAALPFFSLFIIGIGLLAVLINSQRVQNWVSIARGQPANIIINTTNSLGPLATPWRNLAQGGEAPRYRFAPASDKLTALEPQYVRIDHIYDGYDVVSRQTDGNLTFNWQYLDQTLSDITASGAIPFISLSYMPTALSRGDVIDAPQNYGEWALVVQRTIEHISGVNSLNLGDVYYEVWNEPDLFGQWKTYGSKNYLTLYQYAAYGAERAQNVRAFKLGGPATTGLYKNWVTRFFDFARDQRLRVDFYSWHLYSYNVGDFPESVLQYYDLVRQYPEYINTVEPIITEWGINGDLDTNYDNNLSAAHLVSVTSQLIPTIEKAFVFEFQDGKDPNGQELWGRWGMLTHQDFGGQPKPRYRALQLLNRLGPERISLIGNGTWVKGIAAKNPAGSYQVIISNYDSSWSHAETVPVTFQGLTPGTYLLSKQVLNQPPSAVSIHVVSDTYLYTLPMSPNSVVFLELTPSR